MPKKADAATAERLRDLADAEVAAAKERLAKRTEAAARYAAAEARLLVARTVWEATQGEATTDKASAIEQLVETGMKPAQVAELLGLDAKEIRTLRATGATRPARNPDDASTNDSTSPAVVADHHHGEPSHQAA